MTQAPPTLSVNRLAAAPLADLVARAEQLRVAVQPGHHGSRLVDAGLQVRGSVAAGLAVAEVCMAGLGHVRLVPSGEHGWHDWLHVSSSQPVLACLASQYAGWSLAASKEENNGKKFFSLGSGPARALAVKETLFGELGYRDHADAGCLVLEVDQPPPPVVVEKVLRDCGLQPEGLTLIVTPTTSLAGTTQVVARVLEVALHKAHALGFDLNAIVEGSGAAPLPAPGADGLEAMGRTNDAILYGGRVHLTVDCDDEAAQRLAEQMPASTSSHHGQPFAEIFKSVQYDFYKIDAALFAPAEVWVSNLRSGNTFHTGALEMGRLCTWWKA